ncbi:MAG: hypothetical protein UU37_C0008G0006 [Candidatus Gottesmanbacteria bacterium GW2011_GWA2_41_12]|uniref:Beta protein n=1 Tax=Candidatus Gottesmanbacteria bacterium GW2011_GWA2_41_12 TaxID=1618440 RepID=A0A0G0WUX5_9BACT|nr:MAG: hypothetical protein UU37_C0008G0006 [Candidatus Gottesmanbacteria bacterium GW2011_GWA2_41_12]
MDTPTKSYVPILRWRLAEMTALEKLFPDDRQKVTPLVEFIMPAPTTDPNDRRKVIEKPREKFLRRLPETAKKLLKFCGRSSIFVDVHLLDGDIRASSFKQILESSSALDIFSIPVVYIIPVTSTSADMDTRAVAVKYAKSSGHGLCLRIDRAHLEEKDMPARIMEFVKINALDIKNVDLLVDLQIVDGGASADDIAEQLARLPELTKWRSFVVSGGAFPKDLTELEVFGTHPLSRLDWILWNALRDSKKLSRVPTYSDYTVQHPVFYGYIPGASVSASVRYADDGQWQVFRGQALGYINKKPGQKGPGHKQSLGYARALVGQSFYKGETYSFGDAEIKRMADTSNQKTGNPQKWLSIAINHHVTLAARQTANPVENTGGRSARIPSTVLSR